MSDTCFADYFTGCPPASRDVAHAHAHPAAALNQAPRAPPLKTP
jgi:hypothetical protein